jgi:hypothetical protein
MNIRQQRFAEFVASGMAAGPAYIKAGFRVSPNVAKANASRLLLTNADLKAKVAQLRAPQTAECLMTLDAKRRILAEIVRTPIGQLGPESPLCAEYVRLKVSGGARRKVKRGQSPGGNEVDDTEVWQIRVKGYDKLRAIELDSKLAGHFAPAEVVVESGPTQLESIRERAAQVVSALNRSAELRRNRVPIDLGSRDSTENNGNPANDNAHQVQQPVGLSRWGAQQAP